MEAFRLLRIFKRFTNLKTVRNFSPSAYRCLAHKSFCEEQNLIFQLIVFTEGT